MNNTKRTPLQRTPLQRTISQHAPLQHATPQRAANPLRSNEGFTLAEVLVTLLLVGLLTLAVAAGIGTAINAYGTIRQVTEAQAVYNNAVTVVSDELRFAYDVEQTTVDGETVYVFNSTVRDYRLYLSNGANGTIQINSVTNSASGEIGTVEPIDLPLLNTAAGDSGGTHYEVTLTTLQWDNETKMWTYALQVSDGRYTIPTANTTGNTMVVHAINNW